VSSTDCLVNSGMTCTLCQAPIDVLNKVKRHPSQVDTMSVSKLVLRPADCRRKVKPEDECFFKPLKSHWNVAVGIY